VIDVLTEELRAPITEETAELYVGGTVFKTGPPERVGVELEWLVQDADRPDVPVRTERLTEALTEEFDPPLAGVLTTEPGGQLELSSPPAPLADCLAGAAADLDRLRRRVATAGLALTGLGFDPRPPLLQTTNPRYLAMERHFAARGPEGRAMMCSTASVQVCLDAGADDAEVAERWHALHAWLPVLTGLFANSPAPGRRCARTAVWTAIDPSRTAAPAGPDPRAAYGRWALDAELLAVPREGRSWAAPAGITFRDWLRGAGTGLPAPTWADLAFHLTTLFPPVRAQGHLELRAIDAQPGDGWRVVAALVAALLDDPVARATATAATTDLPPAALQVAARAGMTDPVLRRAGSCFVETAVAALDRAGHPELAAEVDGFGER
jgi:glutamate--cysteine ligase